MRHRLPIVALAVLAALGVSSTDTRAAVPTEMHFQGFLANADGTPVSGFQSVGFTIYESPAGADWVWTETQTVNVQAGAFSVILGGSDPLDAALFEDWPLWLGVAVNGAELQPRSSIGAVPYAARAAVANDVTGHIHPLSVTVSGVPVIDATGAWVGNPTGLVGPQGVAGPEGPEGAVGAEGPQGSPGPHGEQGASVVPFTAGVEDCPFGGVGFVVGEAAPRFVCDGAPGAVGPPGPQGSIGATGPEGSVGPQGQKGEPGLSLLMWSAGVEDCPHGGVGLQVGDEPPQYVCGAPAVHGSSCGGAHGESTMGVPETGLCESGVPSAVTGEGPYRWSCVGEHGGATLCSANRSCADADLTWAVNSIPCGASVGATAHGGIATAIDVSMPTAGSLTYACSQGIWIGVGEGTCTQIPPAGMAYIPPGVFSRGAPTGEVGKHIQEYLHSVTLTRGIYMQTTEVTQGQWKALSGGTNPSCFQTAGSSSCTTANANDTAPVENVNWYSVLRYANALSVSQGLEPCYAFTMTGCSTPPTAWQNGGSVCEGTGSSTEVSFVGLNCTGYRLPTESEWEYAARAGSITATYAGDLLPHTATCTNPPAEPALDNIAWWCRNSGDGGGSTNKRTQPVAGKTANAWGLYDMLGNVAEWTWDLSDWYREAPPGAATDPLGPTTGPGRVLRGGTYETATIYTRSAFRQSLPPNSRYRAYGFRLCRTVAP